LGADRDRGRVVDRRRHRRVHDPRRPVLLHVALACDRFVPTQYDDGGYSGGTMERPALKRLLADIEAGQIDVVVVYKSTG
jgi:hypothetical protein